MKRIFILLHIYGTVGALNFKDCGSTAGSFDKVEVSNCDLTSNYCVLKRNTNASIAVNFKSYKECSAINARIHCIMGDIEIPFPIPNSEVCSSNRSDSEIICPLKPNIATTYFAVLPVLANYPSIFAIVKWELKDENNDNIFCIEIPISIK